MSTSQLVLVHGPGAKINMDVWAHITGTNTIALDDGLISLSGSFISGVAVYDHMFGTMSASVLPAFSAPGSSVGMQADIDLDGDLDIGSNLDSQAANFFAVRALTAPNPVNGTDIRIGRATFTVENITSASGATFLHFLARYNPSAAAWIEDGQTFTPFAAPFHYFGEGAGVSAVVTPEPALALLSAVATFASALRPQRRKS